MQIEKTPKKSKGSRPKKIFTNISGQNKGRSNLNFAHMPLRSKGEVELFSWYYLMWTLDGLPQVLADISAYYVSFFGRLPLVIPKFVILTFLSFLQRPSIFSHCF